METALKHVEGIAVQRVEVGKATVSYDAPGAPVDRISRALADEGVQSTLARTLIEIEVLRHHASRTMSAFMNGGAVGPESSGVKLLMAQAEQTLGAAALEVLGDAGAGSFWHERYLYGRAASVYGGTQQIQRDIIGTRILSLPQE